MVFFKNIFKPTTCSDVRKNNNKELAEVAAFINDPINIRFARCNENVKPLFHELQQYYVNIQSDEWKDAECKEEFANLMKKYAECKTSIKAKKLWHSYNDSCEVTEGYVNLDNAQNFSNVLQGGGKKKTKKSVMVGKVKRVIYEGPRGGQYIKQNGGYVALRTVSKK